MAELVKIARATKKALRAEGVYISQANDEAGGQEVFHLHFHVWPRWGEGKELRIGNQRDRYGEKVAERIGKVILET